VLERAANIRMLPIDYRWSDVGSWAALPETREPDRRGNFPILSGGATLVAEDSQGCVVYAEGEELVALLGVRDLIVVRAGAATLVCPRDRAQDVRAIVERLKREAPEFT
jgi:mannose-1-phosphate guanylyltransferase